MMRLSIRAQPSRRRLLTFAADVTVVLFLLLGGCFSQVPQQRPESIAAIGPEVEIPKEFYGCWQGTTTGQFDSVTPLSFTGKLISKSGGAGTTYQFCVKPKANGTGAELKLTKVEIRGRVGTVTYFNNRVTAADAERKTAHLTSKRK
jgi:hypothetical protein